MAVRDDVWFMEWDIEIPYVAYSNLKSFRERDDEPGAFLESSVGSCTTKPPKDARGGSVRSPKSICGLCSESSRNGGCKGPGKHGM